MMITVTATELRKKLFTLLIKLEEEPNTVVRIVKHNKIIGELTAPSFLDKKGTAASVLIQIAQKHKKLKMPKNLAESYKSYLYGTKK